MNKLLAASAVLALTALPLAAQHAPIIDPARLEAAVLDRVAQDDANRDAVRRFLQGEEVRKMTDRLGVRAGELETVLATLDPAALQDLADRTRAAERELAGGDTIVISSTILIIALLVLIIILVAD